jgi:prepilin-type N-terminal cleavage/methylation domain-containing protein
MPISAPSNKVSAGSGFSRRRGETGSLNLNGFTPSRRSAEHGFTPSSHSAEHGFTPSRRSAEHGFTLIEMVVVLVILGIIAIAASQAIGRRPAALARHEAQARIGAAVEAARREAARTGEPQSVDPGALIDGASLAGSLPAQGGRPGILLVYSDGSSNGGLVSVRGRPMARIDWLTAEVRNAS